MNTHDTAFMAASASDNYTDKAWLEPYWMPFSSNRDFKSDPRMIVSADGCYFTDKDGRKIFDGLSGLWCCGLGHGRPEIAEAICRQAANLDYAPAFQFGHPTAFAMANYLKQLTPEGLDYVFLSNSGSEAVETALKMARAYWRSKGQGSRTRFIGREKSYHGVNFGGISIGGLALNRKPFGQGIEADHLVHTQLPQNVFSRGLPTQGSEVADDLLRLLALHDPSTIAAVIIEPFSGSGGVVVPPKGYLDKIAAICRANNILLIFDEVISGFGRIGDFTAAAAFGITPDILICAKQITNGTIPMAATMTNQDIYNTLVHNGSAEYMLEFPHGYTYSGHPVACAAGLASLEILVKEKMIDRVRAIAPYFEEAVHQLRGRKNLTDIRNFGLAAGLSFAPYIGKNGAEPAKRPFDIAMQMWKKGFYVRYGGDVISLAPPFIVEKEEIDMLINALGESIDAVA